MPSKKYNKYEICEDITRIYTSKNEEILVDTESFNSISKIRNICWCINKAGYVVGRDCESKEVVSMHDIIMRPDLKNGEIVDHIYGKRFDNRTSQLRIASRAQNNQNKRTRSDNTSGVVGVYWSNNRNKWYAQITIDGKTKSLGYYADLNDAIEARLSAEQKYFGEFAPQNYLLKLKKID